MRRKRWSVVIRLTNQQVHSNKLFDHQLLQFNSPAPRATWRPKYYELQSWGTSSLKSLGFLHLTAEQYRVEYVECAGQTIDWWWVGNGGKEAFCDGQWRTIIDCCIARHNLHCFWQDDDCPIWANSNALCCSIRFKGSKSVIKTGCLIIKIHTYIVWFVLKILSLMSIKV